ncbi:LexA family protein [Methylomonas fluvii]|uniref:Translesion error-prone DNA polymerase V autoproteolytic subunit n=1 Tax=Methylomonas fluvii TaxID=1854564 RepID=A0ABR9DN32_9GAMM|nr:translesion error-prone DNA polymerase V autoproteolytic subunit [Methylomonas fluvii]MBD9363773.1 translesion error-prone DNA polymerase V autoproteolytic subunit [Methylomonas fluvii]
MQNYSATKRGGKRQGAGRKSGTGTYGETTKAIRVPESLVPAIKTLLDEQRRQFEQLARTSASVFVPAANPSKLAMPLCVGKVAVGFPLQADYYVDKTLDLNELLVQKPAATCFIRAPGVSMLGAGVHPNDILVVDRSIEPVPGKIVICALNGELTVKRLACENKQWTLKADNPDYPDIMLRSDLELVVWGVVTNIIHAV